MEYIDIVDENDNVIWMNTRKESYNNQTTNRIVSVLIFNKNWELLLQKRASTCSFLPWYWALSAWWHVSSWQTYEEAWKMELSEELWIQTDLKYIWKFYWDRLVLNWDLNKIKKSHYFHETIFEWIYDWFINFDREDNDEVDEVRFFTFEEIKKMIEKNTELIMPNLTYVLKKFYF